MQRDMKSFFKNREKSMKINSKWSQINYLHFSRGSEKRVKNVRGSSLSEPPASAGGQFLNFRHWKPFGHSSYSRASPFSSVLIRVICVYLRREFLDQLVGAGMTVQDKNNAQNAA